MAARQIPDLPGFNRFWLVWPANTPGGYDRKGGKSECLKLWAKERMEQIADEIIRHVEFMKTTRKWRETFGEYIPAPAVYLRQKRWDGANIPGGQALAEVAPESARAREARERVERVAPGAAARRPGSMEPTAADWIEYVGPQITG